MIMGEREGMTACDESEAEAARSILDDVVCEGVAIDVFHADQARHLLEAIDPYVEQVNKTGVGKRFIANLQIILERHLCLSIARLYERHSSQYSSCSIPAAIEFIRSRSSDLHIIDRRPLLDFLRSTQVSTGCLASYSNMQLSRILTDRLQADLPKPDKNSARPLDQALAHLKRVRDKAIAHPERVDAATLIVPAWPKLVELIDFGHRFVVLIARSYLNVGHNLESDAAEAASSLRGLFKKAGLQQCSGEGDGV